MDVRLENQYGIDQFQGLGVGRNADQPEETAIIYASTSLHPVVDDTDILTFVVDNAGKASGQWTFEIYLALGV